MEQNKPRQYTAEEVREEFFWHLHGMAKYWLSESRTPTPEGKMYGFIHSLLVTFDGYNGGMPGFLLCPTCHPSDPDYHKENGDNWYPTNEEADMECEISCGDMLHDAWNAFCRKHNIDR